MAVTWKKLAYEEDCTLNADTDLSSNSYFLDEDNMASDSAVKVASQQSVKAYVDAQAGASIATIIAMAGT